MANFPSTGTQDLSPKMLREIANDDITPKKHNYKVQNDLYERAENEEEWDLNGYDEDSVPLAEF